MHTRNELSSGSRCQVKPRCLMIHIYSFISHVGFSTRGVHKETQNKYGHIVSPWEIMMKHDKTDFRDNTFSDKSGCDFKLSQNQLV